MEVKKREIVVTIADRGVFAVRAVYSEKFWGWVSIVEAIASPEGAGEGRRSPVARNAFPPTFATPYESLGHAVAWLTQAAESDDLTIL